MSFPTKEGYLQKYRNKLAGWESRYFKLDRSYLHYYESRDSHQPKKSVLRLDINTINSSSSHDRPNTVEINLKNSSEKWTIQFQSEFEMKEWCRALLAHIPEYDLRRPQWLSDRPLEPPPMEAPPIPQYMLPVDGSVDPPSYSSAGHYSKPSAPTY